MFGNPSLMTRIAIGKGIGFVIGLIGFFMLPALMGESDLMIRWAFLLWYTTFGAIIGLFGVFAWHPILKISMPWWQRGPFMGAWLNFVLTLFIYDKLKAMMEVFFGSDGMMISPFWFVLEGAIVGLIIDYVATKYGGEGKETVGK